MKLNAFSKIINANTLAKEAMHRFEVADVPSRREEAWKYLNVKPLFEKSYDFVHGEVVSDASTFTNRIQFTNGVFDAATSSLPKGVRVYHHTNEKLDFKTTNVFTDLNLISVKEISVIEITENINEPIFIKHLYASKGNYSSNLLLIKMNKNVSAHILDESSCEHAFVNHQYKFVLDENTHLHWTQLHVAVNGHKYQNIQADLSQNANLQYTQVNLGGGIVRQDLLVNSNGEGSHAGLQGLYLLNQKQAVDNHTQVNHLVPNATCIQNFKGILDGEAKAIFDGKIFVAPGADGTRAEQLNKNILLSNTAEVNAKPQLEIYADDVKCNHGATLGKFSEEEIFYFLARGIERRKAIQMLAKGFVGDIILQIQDRKIQQYISPLVEKTVNEYSF